MPKTIKIIEMMPENMPDEVMDAIKSGRLCAYAVELQSQLATARDRIEQLQDIITANMEASNT